MSKAASKAVNTKQSRVFDKEGEDGRVWGWLACAMSAVYGWQAMRHRVREVLELALAQQRRQENECVSELEAKAIKVVICINAFRPAVEGRKDISSRFCLIFAHATDSASFQITPPSCICRFSLRFSTFLMNSDFESCV